MLLVILLLFSFDNKLQTFAQLSAFSRRIFRLFQQFTNLNSCDILFKSRKTKCQGFSDIFSPRPFHTVKEVNNNCFYYLEGLVERKKVLK